MIKKILAGLGATAGIGGLAVVIAYKPHHVPVVTMKPAASVGPAVASPSVSATPTPASPTPAASAGPQATPTPAKQTPKPSSAPTPKPTAAATPSPTPSPTPTGQYKDGSYSGSVVASGYGNVQVQAVVSGGKITGVNFLQMPSGSAQTNINTANCESKLPGETIQAQAANVQTVTGATQTSDAYIQSMTTALQAAKS